MHILFDYRSSVSNQRNLLPLAVSILVKINSPPRKIIFFTNKQVAEICAKKNKIV